MPADKNQSAVIEEVRSGSGHTGVQATAGGGKTFTLLECLKVVPRFKKSIFLSFSNAIVNELKERVPSYIQASTLHSKGCRMIMAKYRGVKVDEDKYFKLALQNYEKKTKDTYRECFIIQNICNYARLTLTPFNTESLGAMCAKYTVEATTEMLLVAEIILVENTKNQFIASIDFTDMLYFPAMYDDFVNETFDYVFLDEAQDNNNCQTKFIGALLKPGTGRLIFVGDKRQSIFGFMGSDIDSFDKLKDQFNAKELKLTVTYRCSKAVVRLAQTIYPEDIQAHPDAPEGIERRGDVSEAAEGDMVICRNTRPLIQAFFMFVKRGKKSFIVGKDLEKGLVQLAESCMSYSSEGILTNMDLKLKSLIAELKEDGIQKPEQHDKVIALMEKIDIVALILSNVGHAIELVPKIHQIFHPEKKAIRLLTSHRSKGLECDRVFYIEIYNEKKLCPSPYAILEWQKIQENNLLFVTYTRAKTEFVFCEFSGN